MKRIEQERQYIIPVKGGGFTNHNNIYVPQVVYVLTKRERKQWRKARHHAEQRARRTGKREHPKREQTFAWDLYSLDLSNLKQAKKFRERYVADGMLRECIQAFKHHRVKQYRKLP
jgi:hypothetical protein